MINHCLSSSNSKGFLVNLNNAKLAVFDHCGLFLKVILIKIVQGNLFLLNIRNN